MQVKEFSVYTPSRARRPKQRQILGLSLPSPSRNVLHCGVLVVCSCWVYFTALSFQYPRAPPSTLLILSELNLPISLSSSSSQRIRGTKRNNRTGDDDTNNDDDDVDAIADLFDDAFFALENMSDFDWSIVLHGVERAADRFTSGDGSGEGGGETLDVVQLVTSILQSYGDDQQSNGDDEFDAEEDDLQSNGDDEFAAAEEEEENGETESQTNAEPSIEDNLVGGLYRLGTPANSVRSDSRRQKYITLRAMQLAKEESHKHGVDQSVTYTSSSVNRTELLLQRNIQAERIEAENQKKVDAFLQKALVVPECKDKERFLRIIYAGRAPHIKDDKSIATLCSKLPNEEQIVARYGPKAVVVGMDTCRQYRTLLEPHHNNGTRLEPMPRVAGLYHTGTNALSLALTRNVKSYGVFSRGLDQYDVPWGKHMAPASSRLTHTYPKKNKDDRFRVLPIAIVRDPFFWMNSMCKEWYDVKWEKPPDRRCPSIVKFPTNRTAYKVHALLHQSYYKSLDNYTSLPHLWSEWNRQYFDADYPRLMIRFEDILYRMNEVITAIRECVGLQVNATIHQPVQQVKNHGRPTDFLPALTKHLSNDGRHHGMTKVDREYSNSALDSQLMDLFGYQYAPLEVDPEDLERPFQGMNQPSRGALEWWLPGFQLQPGQTLGPSKNTALGDRVIVPRRSALLDRLNSARINRQKGDQKARLQALRESRLQTNNEHKPLGGGERAAKEELKREMLQEIREEIMERRRIRMAAIPQQSSGDKRERIERIKSQLNRIANNQSVI